MYPVKVTQTGTGASTPVFPDIAQNPFQIGIGVNIATGAATYSVEHCFDYAVVMSPTWNGTSNVTWFPNSGINGTSVATTNGNYAFPVAAIRLNVTNGTGQVVMNLLQATNAP